jgi:NAD(P)-dependent dehydrogenase (short-subunit alcohol dehydrogenase family)
MSRVVLITGVAGGIGQAIAPCFQIEGWYVVGIDQKPDPGLKGVDCYIQADAAEPQKIEEAIAQITNTVGRLDALINNAAIQVCKPVVETSIAEWDRVMEVNLRSVFLWTKTAHPLLQTSQGSIVNVSSVHAVATSANIAAYAASKGALVAFTRALAIEFAADQIRVNAILPGAVDTPMLRAGLERGHLSGTNVMELMKQLGQKTVMGRVGQPEEIAQAILFLADNHRSAFMTGQALVIDGGATIRLSTE